MHTCLIGCLPIPPLVFQLALPTLQWLRTLRDREKSSWPAALHLSSARWVAQTGMSLVLWSCNSRGMNVAHSTHRETRGRKTTRPATSLGRLVLQQANISLHITRQGLMGSDPFLFQIFSIVVCSWSPPPKKKPPQKVYMLFSSFFTIVTIFPIPPCHGKQKINK